MEWLDPYGLLFMTVIMIPNVLFALLFAPSHILISYKNVK